MRHVHGRLPSFREKAEFSSFVIRRQVYATHGCQDGVRRRYGRALPGRIPTNTGRATVNGGRSLLLLFLFSFLFVQ
jgi:ribosomal protein L35AE/L33A